MSASVHLDAIGPCRLGSPSLLTPTPVKLGGRPWGAPRYGCRAHVRADQVAVLEQICAAVKAVINRQWPDGKTPAQLRHPLQVEEEGSWFHAGAPAAEAPELFHLNSAGDVTHGAKAIDVFDGAEALLGVEFVAYQPVPWAGGVDVLLRAVLLTGAGQRRGGTAAEAFTAAVRGIQSAAY